MTLLAQSFKALPQFSQKYMVMSDTSWYQFLPWGFYFCGKNAITKPNLVEKVFISLILSGNSEFCY